MASVGVGNGIPLQSAELPPSARAGGIKGGLLEDQVQELTQLTSERAARASAKLTLENPDIFHLPLRPGVYVTEKFDERIT